MQKEKQRKDWSWFRKGEIHHALNEARALLAAGLLSGIYPSAVERAGLIALLIHLNDLLQKMDDDGHRLEANHDIHPACNATDITHLINNARNAACHFNSGLHFMNTNKLSYNVVRGYAPNAIVVNGTVLGCDYSDDSAVMFGSNRIYMHRHMEFALAAANAYFVATLAA